MLLRNHIPVTDLLSATSLHTREQADRLISAIERIVTTSDELYVDFSDIQFVSRSFADELIYRTDQHPLHRQIKFCCRSLEVTQLFEAVMRTQKSRARHTSIPVHQFATAQEMLQYFS